MGILAIVAFKAAVSGPVQTTKYERSKRYEIVCRVLPLRRKRKARRGVELAIWPGTGELLEEVDVLVRNWGDWTAEYWDHLSKVRLHARCWDRSSGKVRRSACPGCAEKTTGGVRVVR